mgnify:CR=1 FL=1|jgi:hypothetical protein
MTDDVVKYNGQGHEVIGEIRVLKITHDEGADRPFHLELDVDEGITGEIVKYGSECLGHLDLLSVGLRGALIEGLAREKGM